MLQMVRLLQYRATPGPLPTPVYSATLHRERKEEPKHPMSGVIRSLMRAAHAPIYASRLRVLVEAITPNLRPGDRVLDVGCGVGTLG